MEILELKNKIMELRNLTSLFIVDHLKRGLVSYLDWTVEYM